MPHFLLAIYVVVTWQIHDHPKRWREYQLSQHFFSREVCERYRPALVAKWVGNTDQIQVGDMLLPEVPFGKANVDSSRCGLWQPDPYVVTKLWNGERRYGESL